MKAASGSTGVSLREVIPARLTPFVIWPVQFEAAKTLGVTVALGALIVKKSRVYLTL